MQILSHCPNIFSMHIIHTLQINLISTPTRKHTIVISWSRNVSRSKHIAIIDVLSETWLWAADWKSNSICQPTIVIIPAVVVASLCLCEWNAQCCVVTLPYRFTENIVMHWIASYSVIIRVVICQSICGSFAISIRTNFTSFISMCHL